MVDILRELTEGDKTLPGGGVRPKDIAEHVEWTEWTCKRQLLEDPRVRMQWSVEPGNGPVQTLVFEEIDDEEGR
jgi:hypothetical protein